MSRPIRRKPKGFPGKLLGLIQLWFRELTGEPLVLGQESALLLILSVFDVLMTYALLRQGIRISESDPSISFHFYESNPIAQWWFARWNIAGMAVFKFLMMAVAIGVSEIVERRRPGLGRAVLTIGIIAVGAVVAYSAVLFYRHASGNFG